MRLISAIILLLAIFAYVIIGGIIMHFIEFSYQQKLTENLKQNLRQFIGDRNCLNHSDLSDLNKLYSRAQVGGYRVSREKEVIQRTNWDFASSLFMSLKVVGATGYGGAPPATGGGRLFTVLFAIIGVPLFFVTAFVISRSIVKMAEKIRFRITLTPKNIKRCWLQHLVKTCIIACIAFFLFVVIPAAIFQAIEPWSYPEAFYYCMLTVLTIDFGEYVPGEWADSKTFRQWYRVAVGIWVLLSITWFSSIWFAVRTTYKCAVQLESPIEAYISEMQQQEAEGGKKRLQFKRPNKSFGNITVTAVKTTSPGSATRAKAVQDRGAVSVFAVS